MRGIGRTLKDLRIISYFSKRKRWLILSFCVFLALIIWLLQSLNGTYTKSIELELEPITLPPKYSIDNASELPKAITIEITSTGTKLLNFTLSHQLFKRSSTYKIVVDSMRLDPNGGYWGITGDELIRQVRQSFPQLDNYFSSNEDRISVRPDYLGFSYAPMAQTILPIVFNSQIDFGPDKNRFLESWKMSNEEVRVYGIKSKLDSLRINNAVILTDSTSIEVDNLGLNTIKVALLPSDGVKLSQDSVTIDLKVQELRYYTYILKNIQVRNLPEEFSIRLFPSSVKITYLAEENANQSEIEKNIRLYVDVHQIDDLGNDDKLKVSFDKLPKEVHMIQFEPDQLEFILEEKVSSSK